MSTLLNLTADEITEITGRQRYSSQIAQLRHMGFTVKKNADGRPLVSRAHYLQIMGVDSATTAEDSVQLCLD